MFSWLSKLFDKEDDKFVKIAFDRNKRQALMQQLKLGRLSSLIVCVSNGGAIFLIVISEIISSSRIDIPQATLFLFFLSLLSAMIADSQIKTLLLHDKTHPEA